MTIEERFQRIEHVTAGLAEERRKEREEDRQLWRDTQRRIDDLGRRIADTNAAITRFADETQKKIDSLAYETQKKIDDLAEQDRRLGERVDALVSAIGTFIGNQSPKPQS